jgi:hypothetical protein
MPLRPVPTFWFEALVSRHEAVPASEALGATGAVESQLPTERAGVDQRPFRSAKPQVNLRSREGVPEAAAAFGQDKAGCMAVMQRMATL